MPHYNPGLHYIWNVNATSQAARENRPFSWWPLSTHSIRPFYPANYPGSERAHNLGGHSQ